MFRILDIPPEGPPQRVEGEDRVAPPPTGQGTLRWIDLAGQADADLALLQQRFDFHPLTIEDCSHFDQRPKLEEYGAYLFIVMHGFLCPGDDVTEVAPLELHAFLGKDYLVTVHSEPIPALESVWQRAQGDGSICRRGPDFLYYLLVDAIVDANFILLDKISDALEEIEDAILQRAERQDLARIFLLKRTLAMLRRTLSPQRDVFALLAKRGDSRISERTAVYFRDVYDHLTRIYEGIDAARDLLGNSLDAYLSMTAQRTNDVMKRLTILSAVFLPLATITGFFGMNFNAVPVKLDWLYYAVMASLVAVPLGMLFWFRKSRWI